MGLFQVILFCLVYTVLGQVQEVAITKCCPYNQIFDANSPNHCVNKGKIIFTILLVCRPETDFVCKC